ncbi:MAG: SRPBCC domain-containing protein [bacterium]
MANQTIVQAEAGRQEIVLTYVFDASIKKVFEAFIQKNIVRQWLVPLNSVLEIESYLIQNNGKYRYTIIDESGDKHTFCGVVHEVLYLERIIQTFEYETTPKNGEVSLEVLSFMPLDNNSTKLTHQSIFRSVAERDAVLITKNSEGPLKEEKKLGIIDIYNRLSTILNKKSKVNL